jgi:glutamate dehydrogenase
VALRSLGIDPRNEPWSVKLTGGPDGDVAGNMLKILNREYAEHVRVVGAPTHRSNTGPLLAARLPARWRPHARSAARAGMADGFACAEDPAGLPMPELMRLFEAQPARSEPAISWPRARCLLIRRV